MNFIAIGPGFRIQRQEDGELQICLGYIVSTTQKLINLVLDLCRTWPPFSCPAPEVNGQRENSIPLTFRDLVSMNSGIIRNTQEIPNVSGALSKEPGQKPNIHICYTSGRVRIPCAG